MVAYTPTRSVATSCVKWRWCVAKVDALVGLSLTLDTLPVPLSGISSSRSPEALSLSGSAKSVWAALSSAGVDKGVRALVRDCCPLDFHQSTESRSMSEIRKTGRLVLRPKENSHRTAPARRTPEEATKGRSGSFPACLFCADIYKGSSGRTKGKPQQKDRCPGGTVALSRDCVSNPGLEVIAVVKVAFKAKQGSHLMLHKQILDGIHTIDLCTSCLICLGHLRATG